MERTAWSLESGTYLENKEWLIIIARFLKNSLKENHSCNITAWYKLGDFMPLYNLWNLKQQITGQETWAWCNWVFLKFQSFQDICPDYHVCVLPVLIYT